MSFDAFCLSLLALVFASAFLMKLAEAVQTIAKARLLEAEVALNRDRRDVGLTAKDHERPNAVLGLPGHRCRCSEDPPGSAF